MILLDGLQVGSTNLNSIDLNSIERVEVVQELLLQLFMAHRGQME